MTQTLAEFRAHARRWLAENVPPRAATLLPPAASVRELNDAEIAAAGQRQAALAAAGLAGITWPTRYGGAGLTVEHQRAFDREAATYELGVEALAVGVDLAGPTLLAHGSDAQQAAYLPRIVRGEDLWCQLFSEPGAGSDLASLSTHAVLREDGWHVTGQKVWTSGGQHADLAILVARTDATAPKHRGLTYFVLDMRSPGVTVRPLRQMTGGSHFAEVFLDDVVLPTDAVVGDVGDGWTVVRTTLGTERAAIGGDQGVSAEQLIALARAQHEQHRRAPVATGVLLDAIVSLHVRNSALDALVRRTEAAVASGTAAGLVASIFKLEYAAIQQAGNGLALEILGAEGLLAAEDAPVGGAWQTNLLTSPYLRIAGGTDEIQRNIIAERILGLPADRNDGRSVPFDQLTRG